MAKKLRHEEIKIIIQHKSKKYFLARIVKIGDGYIAVGKETDAELRKLHGTNVKWNNRLKKEGYQGLYLGILGPEVVRSIKETPGEDGLVEVSGCGAKLKQLKKYIKKKKDKIVIIDNSLLKAKNNEFVSIFAYLANYSKKKDLNIKCMARYSMVHFINFCGYFLIIGIKAEKLEKLSAEDLHCLSH